MNTNAGRTPNYTLRLEGNIVEVLQLTPRQLSLGSLPLGVTKQVSFTVTNRGESNVKLLAVNVSSNSLQIKAAIKKGELKPGETGTVELAITPRPEAKVLSGYLHLVTNNPHKKEITVPVWGTPAK